MNASLLGGLEKQHACGITNRDRAEVLLQVQLLLPEKRLINE